MKIAIVDDEKDMRRTLAEYIGRFSEESGIAMESVQFASGEALLENYRMVYDLLILDIDMPGINGMDTAHRIREMDGGVTIIFITNVAQYAIEGYAVDATDYIVKPVSYYDFSMKFHRAVSRAAQRREHVVQIETSEGVRKIRVSAILYIEVLSHYLYFYTTKRVYKVRGNMADIEKELLKYNFVRIHRSYVINLKYANKVLSKEVTVLGKTFPVGRNYRDSLKEEYMRYIRGEEETC